MDIVYGRMAPGQEDEVCELVLNLIENYGTDFQSILSPESLRDSAGFLNVETASLDGKIIGICAWTMSFSTWRGVKGMHVNDHFVTADHRDSDAMRNLLVLAARNGAVQGAKFIRTEVDVSEENAELMYAKFGFWLQSRHSLHFLEPREFALFISG
jgi:hypothetical protein